MLTAAAIAIAVSVLHREFASNPRTSAAADPPAYVSNWDGLVSAGVRLGPPSAPVTVVEFFDLECPFCKTFHAIGSSMRHKYGDEVAFTLIHYPLTGHRFARPAANAAECAREQRKFQEFVGAVFAKQDSLGLKSWTSFAVDAGIRDTLAFAKCILSGSFALVDTGLAAAKRYGVKGTPTVLVNGWRYSLPPEEAQLDSAIAAFLGGKNPFANSVR